MIFKKIIYISVIQLTKKIYADFYLKEFEDLGLEVEYWNVGTIYYGKQTLVDSLTITNNIEINYAYELDNKIKPYAKDHTVLFIPTATFCFKVISLYRIFKKYNVLIGFFARGMLPNPLNTQTTSKRNKWFIKQAFNFERIIPRLQNRYAFVLKLLGYTKKIDFLFSAGSTGFQTIGVGASLDFKTAKKININNFDYDKFLILKNSKIEFLPQEKYAVFLDEYLPYHPDFDMLNMKNIDPDIYFPLLNDFFNDFEKIHSLRVVIAAHPKADYSINPFEGRAIFKNKTGELVKESEMILAHGSTSISYGVLFKKSILLLTSTNLKQVNHGFLNDCIEAFSKALDLSIVDLNRDQIKNRIIHTVNSKKCDQYKYKYLTSIESENNTSFAILSDFFRS